MALKDCSRIERKIIGRVLDNIAMYSDAIVEVFTGLRIPDVTAPITNRAEIEEHIGVSDSTELKIQIGEVKVWVVLIHGNEEDVISDSAHTGEGSAEIENLICGWENV